MNTKEVKEECEQNGDSLHRSLMSSKSIFSDMNISVLIKQALKHPSIEQKTKLSLDFVENNTAYLSQIMNTCNGRDKLLAIIQYS
mmetsp:Transcript_7849/g.8897  ORF Transcript_7849/g.8897 Transcript_7849/m.8897 type:complete len:85 (-) Transcript_7849:347-601(-)